MDTVTCSNCGSAVAEDDAITGTCPVCDNPISRRKKSVFGTAPDNSDSVDGFLKIMDELDEAKSK